MTCTVAIRNVLFTSTRDTRSLETNTAIHPSLRALSIALVWYQGMARVVAHEVRVPS
jgi:hypothetical protein